MTYRETYPHFRRAKEVAMREFDGRYFLHLRLESLI
jgi:hypothetical protein